MTCAFVNNMPDAAFGHTERQFLGLLDAASGAVEIDVRAYALPGVPRSPSVADRIESRYFPFEEMLASTFDIVIVTGSEPLAARLRDEPYWDDLVRLLEWSTRSSRSTLLSCLAAHGALLAFDRIDRRPLGAKRTGVFTQAVRAGHPLTAGIDSTTVLPHSRLNDVASSDVERAGYCVLMGSEQIGWGVIARRQGNCELLLVQGHPEYDASSLVREYRRDVERYLAGSVVDPPVLPTACVAPDDQVLLEAFHEQVLTGPRDPALLDRLPIEQLLERAGWPWHTSATTLYANWLTSVLDDQHRDDQHRDGEQPGPSGSRDRATDPRSRDARA